MKEQAEKLKQLIAMGSKYFHQTGEESLCRKPAPEKWSKKEILGHLIDSAINNLQRFTEIQFAPKPYQIQSYRQVELVKANNYQSASARDLTILWQAVNRRIQQVILMQTELTLAFPIILGNGDSADLAFLIRDYVDHLDHHLLQIFNPLYPTDPRLPAPKLLA
ncbi:DinB family protein [Algoriphagus terrigena]|uniref:DinB family protein n=1 Tax=Algoriphagus terrigena TaxID=344884 RepID=UPI0004070CCA|nr:DinB family protein [Algoriphagus terrigena]